MRILMPVFFALAASTPAFAQEKPVVKNVSQVVELSPGAITTVNLGWGVFTTLKFDQNKPIERVMLGSPIAQVKVDEELNRLDIKPDYPEGATNMIVTIGKEDYAFILRISRDLKDVIYTRTFTLEASRNEEFVADLARMGAARVMKPSEIDTLGFTNVIEKARIDEHFRKSFPDIRTTSIGKVVQWNNCLVHFLEVTAFLDSDLLVFKVQVVNTTGFGLYLHARQLGLKVAGKNIPVKASMQNSTNGFILPDQMETVWLFVQGEKISGFGNDWTLVMPAQANAVRQVLGSVR